MPTGRPHSTQARFERLMTAARVWFSLRGDCTIFRRLRGFHFPNAILMYVSRGDKIKNIICNKRLVRSPSHNGARHSFLVVVVVSSTAAVVVVVVIIKTVRKLIYRRDSARFECRKKINTKHNETRTFERSTLARIAPPFARRSRVLRGKGKALIF